MPIRSFGHGVLLIPTFTPDSKLAVLEPSPLAKTASLADEEVLLFSSVLPVVGECPPIDYKPDAPSRVNTLSSATPSAGLRVEDVRLRGSLLLPAFAAEKILAHRDVPENGPMSEGVSDSVAM
jgi:hypothetical protein